MLIVVGLPAQFVSGTTRDVKTQVFGGEQNFTAFMSSKDVTIERLHRIPVDREHPYPRDAWNLLCYRRHSLVHLSPERAREVKTLLSQPSAYGWDYTPACLPNYGVLLTFHSKPEIKVALCFECDMLAVYTDKHISKSVNQVEGFDSISSRLLAIARGVYPKDSELAKLK